MPNVRFIGDPNDDFSGPSTIRVWGHDFRKGDYLNVPDSVAAKAETHSHFQVEGTADLQPGETIKTYSSDELRDLLDQKGVEYNKQLGNAKLLALAKEHDLIDEGREIDPE